MASLRGCSTRAAVAAAASLTVMAAVLLPVHRTAEASLAIHFMGTAKEYGDVVGQEVLNVFAWQDKAFRLPLPSEIMEQHLSLRTGKEPTRWPDVFHAKIEVKTPVGDSAPMVHSYYEYSRHRMMNVIIPPIPGDAVPKLINDWERRPENYGLSMERTIKAFKQQDDKAGVVDTLDGNLFFPDTAIWALFEPYTIAIFSRSVPVCEIRPAPQHVVPPPDVMSGAKYMGQEMAEGVTCDVYAKGSGPVPFDDKAFVKLYESTESGYPVKFVLFNGFELIFKKFEPNATLDVDDWELPDSCDKEEGPTPWVPFSVAQ